MALDASIATSGGFDEEELMDLNTSFDVVEVEDKGPTELSMRKEEAAKKWERVVENLRKLEAILKSMEDFCALPKNKNLHRQIKEGVEGAMYAAHDLNRSCERFEDSTKDYEFYLARQLGLKIRMERALNRAKKAKYACAGTQTESSSLEASSGSRSDTGKREREPTASPSDTQPVARPALKESRTGEDRTFRTVTRRRAKKPTPTPAGMGEPMEVAVGTPNKGGSKKKKKEKAKEKAPPATSAPPIRGREAVGANPKRRRIRPEALLIEPAHGRSYAEILREVKKGVEPEDFGVKVKGSRPTKTGGILLEVRAKAEDRANFASAIGEVLGERGTLRELIPRAQLVIRDVMETTEAGEIEEALEKFFGGQIGSPPKINLSKRSNRGCILAFVELDAAPAAKLERARRLKVGWVNCRVAPGRCETRCYRCHALGHLARDCIGEDRSDCCWKCGLVGHKAANCQNLTVRRPPPTSKRK